MNIDYAKKINAIAGPWIGKDFHDKLYPRLDEAGIPVFRQEILPLIELRNDQYWWNLRSVNVDFAVIDFHHWFYDDLVFDEYVKRVASINASIVCLGECQFGFEQPPQVDRQEFAKKLFERTRLLSTAIREANSSTVILSPGIGLVKEDWQPLYLDYFVHNRQFFDGYALHVCNNMREHAFGQISSVLNQVMQMLPKKLWITQWAVPAYDGKVINPQVIAPSGWEPFQLKDAAQRLSKSFTYFETVSTAGSHWFYSGTGKDFYRPRKQCGPQEYWESKFSSVTPDELSRSWDYWHFLGLMDADGNIKEPLLQGLVNLANYKNG